jgi:hypothetical protein
VLVCFFFLVNLVDYGLLVFEFTLGEKLLLENFSEMEFLNGIFSRGFWA